MTFDLLFSFMIWRLYSLLLRCTCALMLACGGGSGAARLLLRDNGVEELYGDPTVGPRLKV